MSNKLNGKGKFPKLGGRVLVYVGAWPLEGILAAKRVGAHARITLTETIPAVWTPDGWECNGQYDDRALSGRFIPMRTSLKLFGIQGEDYYQPDDNHEQR